MTLKTCILPNSKVEGGVSDAKKAIVSPKFCDDVEEISYEYVNDGEEDCLGGEDEGSNDDGDDGHDDHGDDGHDDHGDDGPDDHGDSDDAPTAQDLIDMTDTDGSGTMSFDEFIAYMNNPDNDDAGSDDHGDDDHDDEVSMQTQDFMNLTDDDGNGTLSLDEWIDYWNEMNNDEFEEDLDQEGIDTFTEAFEDYDYDANGEVDLDELEDLLDYIYGNSSDDNPDEYDDLNAIFDNNDADMSGDLDVNELDQFILEIDEYFMEEENMACYDTIMEEYDYVRNQTDCDDNGFIWMNLDDDHNENGIEDDYEFICDNGNIIHIDLVDNQMDDCGDGSDEQHSDDHGDSDETQMFTCDNGNEVPADYVDDGDNDCGDWSDEPNHNDNGDDGMDDSDNEDDVYFTCDNGYEVWAWYVDDGNNDCGDWSDEPNHSNNGDGGHGDHGSMFDWMISNSQDMPMEGSFDDYTIVLAMCTMDESSDDGMDMGMGTTPAMNCDDDVLSVTIADAMAQDAVVMFHDADMSGTISGGDMVHISPDIDVDGDWNMVRLYSTSADSYSDENPMLTPGFTGALGMLALLGAALLTRRD